MVKTSSQILSLALAVALPLSTQAASFDAKTSWMDGTSIEAGALYGLIDEGKFSNLTYATTDTEVTPPRIPRPGSNSVLQHLNNSPVWNYFIKGSKWLTKGNDRDISVRYQNLGNNLSDFTASNIIRDTLGQVFTNSDFGDAELNPWFTAGATAGINSSLKYQDIDLKSRNFSSMDPLMLKGMGSIRIYNSYGVKWVNLKKSLNATYTGTQNVNGNFGNAVDNIQFGTNANAGGVRIGMGGLWQFNHYLSLDGEFGVGILAGSMKFDYSENYTNDDANTSNASYNEASKNVLWTTALLDLEVKLNMAWELKNKKTATFSVGYQAEQLGLGSGGTRITRPGSINAFVLNEVFSQQNLLLSVKLSA
jgi:hypothetical protein